MIYGSIQNVLAIGITVRKIEDQVNQTAHFYQGDLVKEKMKSPLKVSDEMINAEAICIDSVILFFHGIYLNGKKLPLSVVVILLQLLLNIHTANAIKKRVFCSLKRIKACLRSTTSQQGLNHLMVLHIHVNLAKDIDLMQVAINMVSKKSEKKEYSVQFVQSSNWILRIYKNASGGKIEC